MPSKTVIFEPTLPKEIADAVPGVDLIGAAGTYCRVRGEVTYGQAGEQVIVVDATEQTFEIPTESVVLIYTTKPGEIYSS